MRLLVTTVLCAVCISCPAVAGETAWQEIAPEVSARLISAGAVDGDGTVAMAIEIDMPAATKTYWRVPGESGLPIDIDLSGSKGVSDVRVHWPYPERELKDGYLDHVYYGHTVLPLKIETIDPGGLVDLKVTLGICSEICIPARAHFSLPLKDALPDHPNALRIRQAMAEVPIAWKGQPNPVGVVTLLPNAEAIGVMIDADAVEADSVIVSGDAGGPLFGAPQKSPQSNLVVLPILGKTDNSALEGLSVEVTFLTDLGAYVVNRTIESGE